MLSSYKAQKKSGYWEPLRPKDNLQRMANMEASMSQQRTGLADLHVKFDKIIALLQQQSQGMSTLLHYPSQLSRQACCMLQNFFSSSVAYCCTDSTGSDPWQNNLLLIACKQSLCCVDCHSSS